MSDPLKLERDEAATVTRSMVGVNSYHHILSDSDIVAGAHRGFVGGLWEEIGQLQFDFLLAHGLKPNHTLVDIGCGALRGGIHFVRYLQPGNYYGLDINPSLISAGQKELEAAGLADRRAELVVNDKFELSTFGRTFDYGLAVSVFTHLYLNHIARCLCEMRKVMRPNSQFFCTFFEAASPIHLAPITHSPGNITTYYDSDPFHYGFEELDRLAMHCGLAARLMGDWVHPRDQRMIAITLAGTAAGKGH
jgi:SAM-dependent methyltransferase